MTQSEVMDAVKPLLDEHIFPGGKTAGWWFKCVQLDLEAKGQFTREPTPPSAGTALDKQACLTSLFL
jgi:hypothetical protein